MLCICSTHNHGSGDGSGKPQNWVSPQTLHKDLWGPEGAKGLKPHEFSTLLQVPEVQISWKTDIEQQASIIVLSSCLGS